MENRILTELFLLLFSEESILSTVSFSGGNVTEQNNMLLDSQVCNVLPRPGTSSDRTGFNTNFTVPQVPMEVNDILISNYNICNTFNIFSDCAKWHMYEGADNLV